MKLKNPPIVEINTIKLSDNVFTIGNLSYDVTTLIRAYQEQNCEIFDMPLAGICTEDLLFSVNSTTLFIYLMDRVNKTDLKYPIILTDEGFVADGWHRICKAILLGKQTIKAVRLKLMPKASGKVEEA